MQEKIKNIIIIIEFIAVLAGIMLINIIKEDEQISILERRKLAQFPTITISSIFNGQTSNSLDKYVTEQFLARDLFKQAKYWFSINILKQQDSDNLFVKDNVIYKMEYPLNKVAVENSAIKIKNVYDKYLQGMNVYYSVIPDKNYYLNDKHLKMDYSEIENIMQANLGEMKYIDIKDTISAESFYRTDLHWKQEKIEPVAIELKHNMNLEINYMNYNEKEAGKFYGVYYGQVSAKVEPDIIKYLTNDIIEECVTYNYETRKEGKIYDLEKYNNSQDKYDVYLSGATPLIIIDNKNTDTDKELLLFRDSFASSLAPFFVDSYSKITLIDIRYMNSDLLSQYIEFENQDVLFLYSGTVLNQNILR